MEETLIKIYLAEYQYVAGGYYRSSMGQETISELNKKAYVYNVVLVAIAVNGEVLGAAEGTKKDKASWVNFFQWQHGRGLDGVKLVVENLDWNQ